MAGLGRVMAEVGAIIIVGGNIAGYTRVMTTTIALETGCGHRSPSHRAEVSQQKTRGLGNLA